MPNNDNQGFYCLNERVAVIYWSTGSSTSLSAFFDWGYFGKDVVEMSQKLKGKSLGNCRFHILSTGKQRLHSWCCLSLIRFLINYLQVNGWRQWWAWLPFLLRLDRNDHTAEVNRTGKDPVLPLAVVLKSGRVMTGAKQISSQSWLSYLIAFPKSLVRFEVQSCEL